MKKLALLLAFLTPIVFTGCSGYHLGADKPKAMSLVTKVAVPTFENDTLNPRLEVLTTNAFIKQLQLDGTFKVVPEDEADAVIKGTISEVNNAQFRSARNNTLQSTEITTTMLLKYKVEALRQDVVPVDLKQFSRRAVVISEPNEDMSATLLTRGVAIGTSNIVLDPDFQLGLNQGLAVAAERLSISLTSQLTEGW